MKRLDAAASEIWKSYYNETNSFEKCFHKQNSCVNKANSNAFFIYESIFEDNRDGVASISNFNAKFLHFSCFFENCSRHEDGGSIYFNCDGYIVQRKFCAINSTITSSNKFGLFSYSYLTSSSSSNNIISESSICFCSSENSEATIFIQFGKIEVFSSNISKNIALIGSGFKTEDACDTGKINFTTFEKNHATSWVCVNHISSDYSYYCCNVINNTQVSKNYGVFYMRDKTVRIESNTIRNPCECATFSTFKGYSGSYIIISCNIDKFTTSAITKISTTMIETGKYAIFECMSCIICSDIYDRILNYQNTVYLSQPMLQSFILCPIIVL